MIAERRSLVAVLGSSGLVALGAIAAAVLCHRSLRAEERTIAGLREEMGKARERIAAIPARERDVILARENVDEISQILPDDKQVYDFVRRLRDFQDESEVRISSLDDSSPKRTTAKTFEPVAYRIQLEGNLWQFLGFLSRLESWQRFVRVPNIRISAGPRPANGDYEGVRHAIRMEVETFAYNPGKADIKRPEIPNYDQKRSELADAIAVARTAFEEPPYDYRGARGRRDPLLDPRLPTAEGAGAGLPLDEQNSLVERLRGEVEKLKADVERFRATENLIERADLRRTVEARLAALSDETGKIEREGKVNYLPLARRFRREVVEGLAIARRGFEAVMAEGPSAEELRVVAALMRERLAAGDIGAALDRFSIVAERLRVAEADPERAPLAAEVRELERRARLAEEFSRLKIQIGGVVVRPDGAVAVINGRTVAEGDALDDDLLVRKIGVEEIEFQYRDLVIAKKR